MSSISLSIPRLLLYLVVVVLLAVVFGLSLELFIAAALTFWVATQIIVIS